jgi:hypothetical protein
MNAPLRHPMVGHLKALISEISIAELMGEVRSPGHPDRVGNYQYTSHGRLFFSCDPRADEVFIDDIARQTSRICRFGGATMRWMSVAEHQWICSHQVPEEHALEALLHDGSEGYIGDLIRPLKYLPVFGDLYLKIEAPIERAIAERFKLTYPWPASVKRADELVVGAELAQNIRSKATNHLVNDEAACDEGRGADIHIHYWTPEIAEWFFLQRFYELADKRGLRGMPGT